MKKWQVVVKKDQEGGKRFRYEDCQRNHAAETGGYAMDGCHVFMEAATDALRCAACHCHRNFHRRKEIVAEVNPTHEKPFDNVQIQSYGTTNLEEKCEGDDEFVKENDKQSTSSVPLESRKSRKRTHNDDIEIQNISTQLTKVAMTLQKISEYKLDVDLLYQEVMKTEGFEEHFLISAFDHLVEHKTFAKGFLVKNDALRRTWLEKFKEKN